MHDGTAAMTYVRSYVRIYVRTREPTGLPSAGNSRRRRLRYVTPRDSELPGGLSTRSRVPLADLSFLPPARPRELFSPRSPRPLSSLHGESTPASLHRWTVITLAARRTGMLSPFLGVASGHPLAASVSVHHHLRYTDLPHMRRVRFTRALPNESHLRDI